MPHIELELEFIDHPKTLSVSPLAQLLFIRSLIYCSKHLTDGFLPLNAPACLSYDLVKYELKTGGALGLFSIGRNIEVQDLIDELKQVGWWTEVENGFEVHDFLDYQISRSQVENIRERNRLNGSKSSGRPKSKPNENPELTQNKPKNNPDLTQSKPNENPNVTPLTTPLSPLLTPLSQRVKKKKDKEEQPPKVQVEYLRLRWNAIPGIKLCKKIEGALFIKMTRLLKEHPAAWWDTFFEEIKKSNFLCGRVSPREGKKPFRADLDWVTGPINLGKISSGKYDDHGSGKIQPPPPPPKTDPINRGLWKQQYGDPTQYGFQ